MAIAPDIIEQWKEVNATSRHWEALVFESAKGYFTVITLALGGAGAAIGWTGVSDSVQRWAVICFLVAALALAIFALVALASQRHFLRRLYERRYVLEKQNEGLQLIDEEIGKSGRTIIALKAGFVIAILLCLSLLLLVPVARRLPLLEGARLQGADLVGTNITQHDLEGACGDANTKLPPGIRLKPCNSH